MAIRLNDADILGRARELPAFPKVVSDIVATLDDENATVGRLVGHIERDPVVASRVMSLANSAALSRNGSDVRDVRGAVSLIGQSRIREIVIGISLAQFLRQSKASAYFWEHSVSVGICALELAPAGRVAPGMALVAGLLHDIGQLWMASFYPDEFRQVRADVDAGRCNIIEAEQRQFGVDHCYVGRLLATHLGLPAGVVEAIAWHHDPDDAPDDTLLALIHVAEVLSNALDLTEREDNVVAHVSDTACRRLGIDWSQDWTTVFGRIEARTEYACAIFR